MSVCCCASRSAAEVMISLCGAGASASASASVGDATEEVGQMWPLCEARGPYITGMGALLT